MALCICTSCTFLPKPSFASDLKPNAPYLEPGSSSLGPCGGIGVEIMGGGEHLSSERVIEKEREVPQARLDEIRL